MPHKFILIRDVTRKECPWLEKDFHVDEEVYEFIGHTYGCISRNGIPCTENSAGDHPFFELPKDAIK